MTSLTASLHSRGLKLAPWLALLVAAELFAGFAASDPKLALYYIVGLAGIGVAGVSFVHPALGAVAMIFVLYIRISDVIAPDGGLLTLNQAMTAFFLALMLLHRLIGLRQGLLQDRRFIAFALYGAAMLLSAIPAADKPPVIAAVIAYVREIAIIFVLFNLVTDAAGMRLAAWALAGAGGFLATASMFAYAAGIELGGLAGANVYNIAGQDDGIRLTGTVGDPNFFAQMLVTVVPVALVLAWAERRLFLKATALGCAAAMSAVIMLTFSRGGLLALFAVLIVTAFRLRARRAFLLAAIVMLGLSTLAAPQTFWNRIDATFEFLSADRPSATSSDASLDERSKLWRVGALMFLEHPALGIGRDNYNQSYPSYAWRIDPTLTTTPMAAHSTPVQVAAETGVIGLLSLAVLSITMVLAAREARRRFIAKGQPELAQFASAAELGIYGYLTSCLFLSDAYPRTLWLMFGFALITLSVARNVDARERFA